jgi:LysR family glycine cleavage system transcriptional activator
MVMRIPPLAALRAFAEVAGTGSFARAAAVLNVTTSAVSHQVRGLEASLGTALLVRAANGASRTEVTAEGAVLLRAVQAALGILAEACGEISGRRRELTVSANTSVCSLWLAPLLARFAALHPSIAWRVRAIDEEPDLVREGLDLAVVRVRLGALMDGDEPLFRETMFPVCSPTLGLAGVRDDLIRHGLLQDWIAVPGTSPENEWRHWLALLGVSPRARVNLVQFSNYNQVVGAAIAGAGIAIGRVPLIAAELAGGRLVRVFDAQMPGGWEFVMRGRPGTARDVHVGILRDFLRAAVGEFAPPPA